MLRREVLEYAEKNDPEYGRCGTCKHWQHLDVCNQCSHGSRYSFDWKAYLELHKEEMTIDDERI